MAVTLTGVKSGSLAQRLGLREGTRLLAINGREINDGLDYEFYATGAQLQLELEDNGLRSVVNVSKDEYEPLGCEFGSYLIDKQHSCCNKCVFCFIDQMPKGMRQSLYFKDDDERLSFLFGNYVTLTNLSDREVERIIEMRISPINISVHTTNPALRVEMMKNKHAGEVLRYIPQLAAAGIAVNTQLVLCPGINDGEELRRSIEWLAQFAPAVESIAAVPVGLTKYREGLSPLRAYTASEAATQLGILLEYGERLKAQHGVRIVYPSDEWFLLAGHEIPREDFYDGYPQLENGVGMWRLLYEEFTYALADAEEEPEAQEADLAVGVLAAPLLQTLAGLLSQRFPQVKLHVHVVHNHFFGPGVTVTGLITGGDIMAQLKGKLKSTRLLLPESMLRAEGDKLLDDTTPQEIAEALDVDVEIVPGGGDNLLAAVLDKE